MSPRRRAILIAALALVVVGAVIAALVLPDRSSPAATADESTTLPSAATPSTRPESSVPDSDEQAVPGTTTETEVAPPSTSSDDGTTPDSNGGGSEPDEPEVSLPALPQLESTEIETCAGIKAGLQQYRDLAAGAPYSALVDLQMGLTEFEDVADFVAEGHDWGVLIVEELVLVRRDWSTAHTADAEGDPDVATARRAAALASLDAAIAVPCPE